MRWVCLLTSESTSEVGSPVRRRSPTASVWHLLDTRGGGGAEKSTAHAQIHTAHDAQIYTSHHTQIHITHGAQIHCAHNTQIHTLHGAQIHTAHEAQINRTSCKKTEHIAQTH